MTAAAYTSAVLDAQERAIVTAKRLRDASDKALALSESSMRRYEADKANARHLTVASRLAVKARRLHEQSVALLTSRWPR